MTNLTLSEAKAMLEAAEKKALEMKVPVNIAICDSGGNLIAHARMDGATIGTIELAINKAYTAAAFGLPTDEIAKLAQPGGMVYGIQHCSKAVIFGGGVPVRKNGHMVGAIGVSGGMPEQDDKIADAAIEALSGNPEFRKAG